MNANDVVAWATVVLALVTTALAFFTYRLWRATGTLVLDAAATAKRQLRAYVFVAEAGGTDLEALSKPSVHVVFKNSGQTPAHNFRITGGIAVGLSFEHLPRPRGESDIPLGILAPGATNQFTSVAPEPLSAAQYGAIAAGKLTLFAHGVIHYDDVFKRSHYLRYRLMIGGPAGIYNNKMAVCREGNETDETDETD
jgi:hypothetical protein